MKSLPDYIVATEELKKKRDEASGKSAFGWRVNFPRCDDIYFSKKMKSDDRIMKRHVGDLLARDMTIFSNGGPAFLPDPWNSKILENGNPTKLMFKGFYTHVRIENSSGLTIDDLADGAASLIKIVKEPTPKVVTKGCTK